MKAVFDTNILIDYLNGIPAAKEELARYKTKLISVVTSIEVLVGANTAEEEAVIRGFLASFEVKELSEPIANVTVALRKEMRLKVPDAIVYATARVEQCLLVTRNVRVLKPGWPDVRMPYEV